MVECLEFRIENSNPNGLDSGSLKLQNLSANLSVGYTPPLHYGKFVFPQLKKGQGITLANSIRRVLLYDVSGIGITHLRFRMKKLPVVPGAAVATNLRGVNNQTGALHEFSSIPGMRESVLELLVNLRAVVWKSQDSLSKTNEVGKKENFSNIFSLKKTIEQIKKIHDAKQPMHSSTFILQAKHLGNERIVNPEHYLATILIDECPDFEIDYILGDSMDSGVLKSSSNGEELVAFMSPNTTLKPTNSADQSTHLNNEELQGVWLPTDGNFFPVKKVNYSIEESGTGIGSTSGSSSAGNIPYSESVFLEIWTNGALHPQESLHQALAILIKLFGG